ncbi:helix-turn-helix transcriptional regulator [Streptomyces sp. NPDC002490]|uniref:helix-turn-helix domain-containing protein n=1 Tax=Streptomyces sp. NPDC002490 TaxID=3154416 RepID=UPI003324A52D
MANIKDLNPDESPQAALGARLRQKRLDLGLKQKELAQKLGYSPTQLSHTETGRKMATLRFVRKIDMHFGLAGTEESFERQWREIKFGALLEGFPEYLELEERAAEIRLFEVGVIPGLLQTRAYAQVLADAAVERKDITPEKAAERVEYLIKRQQALDRTPPPLIFAVLDESCLRRPIGDDPAVMRDQFAHLIKFARLPHTSLQIAPYTLGARRPFNRPVNLLTLPDRSVVSYLESQAQGQLDRELSSVLPRVRNYHLLQTESPSQAESVAMIEQLRKGIT